MKTIGDQQYKQNVKPILFRKLEEIVESIYWNLSKGSECETGLGEEGYFADLLVAQYHLEYTK